MSESFQAYKRYKADLEKVREEQEHERDKFDYSSVPMAVPKRIVTSRQNPLDAFDRPGEFREVE